MRHEEKGVAGPPFSLGAAARGEGKLERLRSLLPLPLRLLFTYPFCRRESLLHGGVGGEIELSRDTAFAGGRRARARVRIHLSLVKLSARGWKKLRLEF